MRLKITLDLTDKKIPVKYNSLLQGMIYYTFIDNPKVDKLHSEGFKIDKRKFKLFTFSEIYGDSTFLPDTKELLFHGYGAFELASAKDDLILSTIEFLRNNRKVILGNQIVNVNSFSILSENIDDKVSEVYYTISPVTAYKTLENKKTMYIHPNDSEFDDYIINNLSKKYFLMFNENMPAIQIINKSNIKEKKIYFRDTWCIAYHLTIEFNNLTEKVKKTILCCGVGSKNSIGLGMLSQKIIK